jgi:predicted phage terminase large subunit-like protein
MSLDKRSLDDPASIAAAAQAILRRDFESFIRKTFGTLSPGAVYLPNWHIRAIAYALDEVREGRTRRLIINLPPRSLKSVIASVAFPAFVLGRDPARRIICVSYASDLAVKHANDFRAVIASPWFKRVFPSFQVSAHKNTEFEVTTTRQGMRLATSVGGVMTGRGGDLILIDDPIKPADAMSDSKRDFVNQWYYNTLISRLDNKVTGAIVIIMQRVHMDDLVGHVTKTGEDWTILNLPAIADCDQKIPIYPGRTQLYRSGAVLHPKREPLAVLENIRSQLGSDTFSAQYQQQPVPPGGAMIKRKWIMRYDTAPDAREGARIVQSWDTASKGGAQNDWSVCTTWVFKDQRFYLLDVHRARYDYPALKHAAIRMHKRFDPDHLLIEDAGTGTSLIAELKREGIFARPIRPNHDKITRMSVQSAKFEAGAVYLPHQAPWLSDFEAELLAFPGAKFDDQVDSTSQALEHGSRRLTLMDVLD